MSVLALTLVLAGQEAQAPWTGTRLRPRTSPQTWVTSSDYPSKGLSGGVQDSGWKKVAPIGEPASWVTPADYPAAALRNREQGLVSFRLVVGPDGTVQDCEITGPVSPALDQATCDLLKQRARFTPAADPQGKPATANWRSRINWMLPQTAPWTLSANFSVAPDGTLLSCRHEAAGRLAPADDASMCGVMRAAGPDKLKQVAGGANKTVNAVNRNELVVDGVRVAGGNVYPAGLKTAFVWRAVMDVDEKGAILSCTLFDHDLPRGAYDPAHCPQPVSFVGDGKRHKVEWIWSGATDGDPAALIAAMGPGKAP